VRGAACALLVVAAACAPARPVRVFPADKTYPDQCPRFDIYRDEFAALTVVESRHQDDQMLFGYATCDAAADPACMLPLCERVRGDRDFVCTSERIERKLYPRRAGPDGPGARTQLPAEPFCWGDRCQLGLALAVVREDDGAVVRRLRCRLVGSLVWFKDSQDPRTSVRVQCKVKNQYDGSVQPRDCYPVY